MYLTTTGLLIVREDVAFFTSNDYKFRRKAASEEVEFLTKNCPQIDLLDTNPVWMMRDNIRLQKILPYLYSMEYLNWGKEGQMQIADGLKVTYCEEEYPTFSMWITYYASSEAELDEIIDQLEAQGCYLVG